MSAGRTESAGRCAPTGSSHSCRSMPGRRTTRKAARPSRWGSRQPVRRRSRFSPGAAAQFREQFRSGLARSRCRWVDRARAAGATSHRSAICDPREPLEAAPSRCPGMRRSWHRDAFGRNGDQRPEVAGRFPLAHHDAFRLHPSVRRERSDPANADAPRRPHS